MSAISQRSFGPRAGRVVLVLLLLLAVGRAARADSDHDDLGALWFAEYGLIACGALSVGLAGADGAFIAYGPNAHWSRFVVGLLSVLDGATAIAAGSVAITYADSGSSNREVLLQMGIPLLVIGAATSGLGIGSLVRYYQGQAALAPLMLRDRAGLAAPGLALAGTF